MVTVTEKEIKELADTEAIIEEFKQRLTRTFLKEKETLYEIADREAKHLLADAYNESSRLTQKAQQDAEAIVDQAREAAAKETQNILSQASLKADKVIREAEERIRKEAKERSSKEVATILRRTTEDASRQAEKILQEAREEATRVTQQMIAEAEKKADELMCSASEVRIKAEEELTAAQKKGAEAVEQMIAAARQTAQGQAEKDAQLIIAKAKAEAEKEKENMLASALAESRKSAAAESASILVQARKNAEEIISQAKDKVRNQIEESSRLMQEIHQKMQQVMAVPGEGLQHRTPNESQTGKPDRTGSNPPANTEPAILRTDPGISNGSIPATAEPKNKINSTIPENDKLTHSGRLKIDIAPPSDSEQIEALEKELMQNSSLRIIAKGGSEDGSAWLEIFIKSPMSLVEVLRKSRYVKDVVGARSYIIVSLHPRPAK